jgi:hypothetical protein
MMIRAVSATAHPTEDPRRRVGGDSHCIPRRAGGGSGRGRGCGGRGGGLAPGVAVAAWATVLVARPHNGTRSVLHYNAGVRTSTQGRKAVTGIRRVASWTTAPGEHWQRPSSSACTGSMRTASPKRLETVYAQMPRCRRQPTAQRFTTGTRGPRPTERGVAGGSDNEGPLQFEAAAAPVGVLERMISPSQKAAGHPF